MTTYSSETRTYIETFLNYHDAASWMEGHMRDFEAELSGDWKIRTAQLAFINESWRVGIIFEKAQGELDIFGSGYQIMGAA